MAFAAEQGMFFICGTFLWMSVLGGEPESRRSRAAAGIAALLLTVMHMTLLGALLALSPRPLYEHLHGGSGLSALADQQLGGVIMLIVGAVSYLAGGLWLSFELLRQPQRIHNTQ
jgi:putative membrane protein